jgi:hypothetical protein
MKIRIPYDQYENAKIYLQNSGYRIITIKQKKGNEILIIARKTSFIYSEYQMVIPNIDYFDDEYEKLGNRVKPLKLMTIEE